MKNVSANHKFRSTNPATGELLATFSTLQDAELEVRLRDAASAQKHWGAASIETRAAVLRAVGAALRAERAELGRIATLEMGKTYVSAMAEADKSAAACDWYAEHGADILKTIPVAMPSGSARVRILPLGVVLAIMPWNFPIWQAMRFIAPALMAGNGILLKHAANVPQCAMALERIVRAAAIPLGMPAEVFTNLFVDTPVIPAIIADNRVAAVTLTGSERAGMAVGEAAGRALKKCVLELGGSDPFIVMPSADFDRAVATGVTARMQNTGQSCVCAKRFIVHSALYDRFEAAFTAAASRFTFGDPMDSCYRNGTDLHRPGARRFARPGGTRDRRRRPSSFRRNQADRPRIFLPADRAGERTRWRGGRARGVLRPGRYAVQGGQQRGGTGACQ